MEFLSVKKNRNRKKKRNVRKRRRERIKLEVKSIKSQRLLKELVNVSFSEEKIITETMQADAFWKNYAVAQEWQKRHSVIWWRSRCLALEHENELLRNKIRSLIGQNNQQTDNRKTYKRQQNNHKKDNNFQDNEKRKEPKDDQDLEFHVDEDMMTFLEQSIRHKMELKQKREQELAASKKESIVSMEGGAAWALTRSKEAKLLYGDASPTILAMETALQATIERHKDKSKPQYWPNIPLRL
ncbi:gem-associated protein 8-like [Vespa velutina]|uniref:gem-associated protein 8-like n=1 Tax=Vespa velutina TaxID=202808 RepID=UPI001FB205FC|nr:gem-associated protein 8-like [Vespa velutina]